MKRKLESRRWVGAVAALVFLAVACGGTTNPPANSKGTLTVGGFNFPESSILAGIYGGALEHDGYTIKYKLLLGTRQVVAPAIQSGSLDLYPGYAASDLEYYNKSAGEATSDPAATTTKLNSRIGPLGLVALTPSPAVDQNAFAVTKATADKYKLKTLSDLAPVAKNLVLGAGPECPKNPFCEPGLKKVYGLTFKAFKPLDTDGSLTRAAFKSGSIDVGLVFTTDADLDSLGLVVLEDDKHLTAADNVVPILRQAAASDEVKSVLNAISAKLTTVDLKTMNGQVANQHQDADAVAKAWLQQHNFSS